MAELTALIPMRHHSQRVPGKNFREFAGKPLFHYILETLGSCSSIARIVVDTDSPVIMESIRSSFPEVNIIKRSFDLTKDDISMNKILLHDIQRVDGEFFLQTHATNPLLTAKTIERAVRTFFDNYPEYDTLFSVTRLHTRLYNQDGTALNHDPSRLIQTQDLPPVFEENSCIYIFTRNSLETYGNRLGSKPFLFEIPRLEAQDIDTEHDFAIAEMIMKERNSK